MKLSAAPFFTDVHPGPTGGMAHWAMTTDEKRIRIAHWPVDGAKGTVLIFPGRTEYIEKYGIVAEALAQRGFASMAIDWRGQGLADRLLDDPRVGHVDHFTDYQKDVATLLRAARELGLPRPFFLLAHSMGGCIGLRAVMEGMPVQAAAFTGPMWGIALAPHMRIAATALSHLMPRIGRGHLLPPGRSTDSYVLNEAFEVNMLTTDPDMYAMMCDQLLAHPELELGGPSFLWLREALSETKHLASRSAPSLPTVTWMGTNERIVDTQSIVTRMDNWTGGRLEIVEGGEHEVLFDPPARRTEIFDALQKHFLATVAS